MFFGINHLDGFKEGSVYRSLGGADVWEKIGCGFMDKGWKTLDFKDYLPGVYSLIYVLRGAGRYVDSQGGVHALRPGSFFQRIPGATHSNYIDPGAGWLECFVEFGPVLATYFERIRLLAAAEPVGWIDLDLGLANRFLAMRERLRAAEESELPFLALEVAGLAAEVLRRNAQAKEPDDDAKRVETACAELARDFQEQLDLRTFCKARGWGYEKFRKDFQAFTGLAPGQYRNRRRLDAACQALRGQDKSVKEIALELGYSSPYEFSARFKRAVGVAPGAYRSGRSAP